MSVLLGLFALYWHFIAAYVGGGVFYAVLKWVFNLIRLRRQVLEINGKDISETNDSVGSAFNNKVYLRDQATRKLFSGDSSYPPKASENKAKLFGWAVAWPINLVYTLFADVIREAWNFIYDKCGALLDSISNAILPK